MSIRSLPAETILRKRKALLRELGDGQKSEIRVAVLGGSTTNEVVDLLELMLLESGIRAQFYQSGYNRFYEESAVDTSSIAAFQPTVTYVHTSWVNIGNFPPLPAAEAELSAAVRAELARFIAVWDSLQKLDCLIVQNNFELPPSALLGNLDCADPAGHGRFIAELNREFALQSGARPKLLINDLHRIASSIGLDRFHDSRRWFSYKLICTPQGSLEIAASVAALIQAAFGGSRKCLVLDLDDTLWGGIIGDDGPEKIQIGQENAVAEAHRAFQQYCLQLKQRGILLAVCSKNEEATAKLGLEHPDSVLRFSDFACFRANWQPKHENIQAIARELNIGLESIVFVDDNPAERALIAKQLPQVAVPDVGTDVSDFIRVLEHERYFEPVTLSGEDLQRSDLYRANALRFQEQSRFRSYDEYLQSLEMSAEIAPFQPVYLERIAQLINKTNQFNLTTRRFTLAEVERLSRDPGYLTLAGRLSDKYGDNGLISVVIGRRENDDVHLELWLMSCRVIKRSMEAAMLDALVAACSQAGIRRIFGYYIPSGRNAIVQDHYASLGFRRLTAEVSGRESWLLDLSSLYTSQNRHIRIRELARA